MKKKKKSDEEDFTFEDIGSNLSDLGLDNPTLEVLEPKSGCYKTLAFQIGGKVEAGKDIENDYYYIKNKENKVASEKFKAFFELARTRKVHLAITPEYSCPWNIIENYIINKDVIDSNFPKENNLWVVGCESITQNQLKEIKEKHNEGIYWIFEEDKLAPIEPNKFLDPVCYIFQTTKKDTDELVNVIIVQFKTQFMGGETFEKDHMIQGKKIYILRNQEDSNSLVTLICSDSLLVKLDKLPGNTQRSYFILHIQLNKYPLHPGFSNYRAMYYGNSSKEREFLCLNWAKNSFIYYKLPEDPISSDENYPNDNSVTLFGGSALYSKKNKLNLRDSNTREKLRVNHEKGLHYAYSPKPVISHIHFFNYNEYVFEFESDRSCQGDKSLVTQWNSGPSMGAVYEWKNSDEYIGWEARKQRISESCNLCDTCIDSSRYWKTNKLYVDRKNLPLTPQITDHNLLNSQKIIRNLRYCPLADDKLKSFIDKEWFLAFSLGEVVYSDWPHAESICLFHTKRVNESNEANRRLTFLHDSQGSDDRYTTMIQFFELYDIVKDKSNFPECISNLAGNCCLKFQRNEDKYSYFFNLYSNNGSKASVAYITNKRKKSAEKIYRDIRDIFVESHYKKRVVVWFKGTSGLETFYDKEPSRCNDCFNHSDRSCRKGGHFH